MIGDTKFFPTWCMRVAVGLIATCISSALSPLAAYADIPPPASESARIGDDAYSLPLCELCGASGATVTPQSFDSVSVCAEAPGGVAVSAGSPQGGCRSIPVYPYPVGIELIARGDGSVEVALGRLKPPGQDGQVRAQLIDSAVIPPPSGSTRGNSPGAIESVQALLTRQLVAILPLGRDYRFDSEFCASTLASAVAAVTLEACALHPGLALCRRSLSPSPLTRGLAGGPEGSTLGKGDLCPSEQMKSFCNRAVPPEPQSTASNLAQALQRAKEEATWGDFWWGIYIEFGSCGLVRYDSRTKRKYLAWDPKPGKGKGECSIQQYFVKNKTFATCVKVENDGCEFGECCQGADPNLRDDWICEPDEADQKTGPPRAVQCVKCKYRSKYYQTSGPTTPN